MRTILSFLKCICVTTLLCQPVAVMAAVTGSDEHSESGQETSTVYKARLAQNTPHQYAPTDAGSGKESEHDSSAAGQALSIDEIAIELSNPVGSMIIIDNEFQYRGYQGSLADASDESAFIYQLQPTFPFPLDNGKNILLRFRIPINGTQPIYEADEEYSPFLIRQIASTIPTDGTFDNEHGHSHLADIGFDIAYGGVSDNGFISMFGIAGKLPTSQDFSQSVDQIRLGPEIAFGKVTDWGIYGAWATHLVRLSGEDAWDTNMTSIKIFFAYGLRNGWQIISNPNIEYDWEGDKKNKLFLPIGAGVAKTMKLGRVPLRLSFEIQYYIESPDSIGPEWLMTLGVRPAFANPLLR